LATGNITLRLGAGLVLLFWSLALAGQRLPAESRAGWQQYLEIGQRLFSKGLYDAAEEAFQGAVREAGAVEGSAAPLGTALTRLGLLYHVQKRYLEADQAYQNALDVLSTNPQAAPREYSLALAYLADLHLAEGRRDKARQLYRQSIEQIEAQIGAGDRTLIRPLQGLARLDLLDGDYKHAAQLAERALGLNRNAENPAPAEIMECLEIAGTAYAQSGHYGKAEPMLRELLRLAVKEYGDKAPQTSRVGERLANVYRERLQFAEAETLLQQRLSSSIEEPGENEATTLNNLAEYLLAQQCFKEAEILLLRSLRIRKSVPGEQDPELAVTLYNLASLYADQGRIEEARKLLSDALSICEKSLPPVQPARRLIRSLQQRLAVARPHAAR
jgi:tetratricopeptide (TPR) repeat protein